MVLKTNWDVAVDAQAKRVGIGVVVRDSNGDMLACLCSSVGYLMKSIVAKALALRSAAILCSELGLSNVVLEGDSQMVVKATNSDEELWAEYENIIKDT